MHCPDIASFETLATENDFVPVYRRLLSDTLTPVSAFRLLTADSPKPQGNGACLFESVIGGEKSVATVF